MDSAIIFVLQTIIQTAANSDSADNSVLGMLDLSAVNWRSNPGAIVAALLHCVGLAWSRDGKRVWRIANDTEVLTWAAPVARTSLRPPSRNAAARDEVQAASGQHDTETVKVRGSAAQKHAAKAATLVTPRSLATAPRMGLDVALRLLLIPAQTPQL